MVKNILITGATSGIGNALAISYHQDGNTVIALGRNTSVISELTQIGIDAYCVDLTSLIDVLAVADLITVKYSHVDIAILNAGTCEYIDIKNFDAQLIARVINANIISFANSVQAFLPLLRLSLDKHLVGTASMAGYLPLPRAEAYGASKAAIQYFLEALAIDLADEGFIVTTINPGFVKTPLTNKNDFPMPFILETEQAVTIIKSGIASKKIEINFPWKLNIPIKILRFCPKWLWRKLARNFKKK
jgi:short-subunit dehydrogenase